MILRDWKLPHDTAMSRLDWSPLALRRKRLKLMQFFKFYRGTHAYPTRRFVHICFSGRRVSLRLNKPHALDLTAPRTLCYSQCFEYSVLKLWNALSCDDLTAAPICKLSRFKDFIAGVSFH